jgi:hypothetical protein
MSESKTTSSGIGFFGALFLVFLVLKLCKIIAWSWWWITAPLWIPFVILLCVCIVIFFCLIFK